MTGTNCTSFEIAERDLRKALQACNAEPGYAGAVALCAADRELWVSFYDAWLDDPVGLRAAAVDLAKLMIQAAKALAPIEAKGARGEHLKAMKANTASRIKMFQIASTDQDPETSIEQIDAEYERLMKQRKISSETLGFSR